MPRRWLYHLKPASPLGDAPYRNPSLEREGFIHASFRDDVLESARLYFPAGAPLDVLQIDPLRLRAPLKVEPTPRGPMPHVYGPIERDAIRAVLPLSGFSREAAPDTAGSLRVGFVVFEGMTLLDLVAVYDPLSRLRSMGFDPGASCEWVAAHEGPLWSADGATITVGRVRPDLRDFDLLVIPGGHGARAMAARDDVVSWLQTYPDPRLVASVCTGALLLGAMGRLGGRRATTHASAMDELGRFGAIATRERVVDEGQTVTAGGVTCGLDLGLHLVERLEGRATAEAMARQMEVAGAGGSRTGG